MADNSITTLEERKGVYDSMASELNARVENIKKYLKQIKELKQESEKSKEIVTKWDEKIRELEAVLNDVNNPEHNNPENKEKLKAFKISRGLEESQRINTVNEMDEITLKMWSNINEDVPELIGKTYNADIDYKKAETSEKQKKVNGELAEANKKEKEAEDVLKSASPPSKWEKAKFFGRKIARVAGWVMLGLAVLAPLVASAILGTITTVVGMAVSSLSGGASLALAIYGVYKYDEIKNVHKSDKNKSYKWANKDKAYKKKEKEVLTATKNLQTAKTVQEQKKKESEKVAQKLKDLDNVYKQNTAESYVVRGTKKLEEIFDDASKINHLKWKTFFTKYLQYLYIHDRLNASTYENFIEKVQDVKANNVNCTNIISERPDQIDFWDSNTPPYLDRC